MGYGVRLGFGGGFVQIEKLGIYNQIHIIRGVRDEGYRDRGGLEG